MEQQDIFQKAPQEEQQLFQQPATPEPAKDPERSSREAMLTSFIDTPIDYTDKQNYLATLMETKRMAQERAEALGELKTRQEQAYLYRTNEIRDFVEFSKTAEDRADQVAASFVVQEKLKEPIEVTNRYALETRAVEKMEDLSLSDPYQRQIILDNMNEPSIQDARRNRVIKSMMWQEALASTGVKDRKLAEKALNFIGDLVFFWDEGAGSTFNFNTDASIIEKGMAALLPGRQLQKQGAFEENLSPQELAQLLPEFMENVEEASSLFGKTNKAEMARYIEKTGVAVPTTVSANTWNLIEMAAVVPVGRASTVVRPAVSVGARTEVTELLASGLREAAEEGIEVAAKKRGLTTTEMIEESLPTALVNKQGDGLVGISTDVVATAERGEKIAKKLTSFNAKSMLTDVEYAAMRDAAEKEFGGLIVQPVKDVGVRTIPMVDGSSSYVYEGLIGKLRGTGGYASKKSAENVGTTYGIAGEATQDASGQWFFKASVPVKDIDSFVTRDLKVDLGGSASQLFGGLQKLIRGSGIQSDARLHGAAQIAGRQESSIMASLEEMSYQSIGQLSKKEVKTFDDILEYTRDLDERWLTTRELNDIWLERTGEQATERVHKAYSGVRQMMDLEYYWRDGLIYKDKIRKGFETVELPENIAKGNAKVKRGQSEMPERFFDVEKHSHSLEHTAESWAELKKKGYIHVVMEEGVEMFDGTIVKDFVGPPNMFKVSPLVRHQLGVRAGVHRAYRDKYFSKAQSVFKQPDTGKEVSTKAKTYRTFASRKQADEWNETMNAARLVYLADPEDVVGLAKVLQGRGQYPSPEEFIDKIKEKWIDPKQAFETVEDGISPTDGPSGFGSSNSAEGLFKTHGRAYTSKRGDRKKGFDGKEAPVLSIGETLNKSVRNIARHVAFDEHMREATASMLHNFSKYIDKSSVPAKTSLYRLLSDAELLPNTPPAIKTQFDTQRQILKRQYNVKSDFEMTLSTVNRQIQDMLVDTDVLGKGVDVANWYSKRQSPLSALRGMAFHLNLGLFNPAQFPLQISTTMAAATLTEGGLKQATQNFASGFMLRYAAGYRGDSAAVFAKRPQLAKAMGFDTVEEAVEMTEAFKRSGWLDVNLSHQLANTQTGKILGAGKGGTMFEKFKKSSGTFFYEPEKFNRAVAYRVAWNNVSRRRGEKLSRSNPDHMNEVMDLADTYSMQMTSESRAAWQKGPASLPTQFFSYPFRMAELIMSKKLTTAQRSKLLASQVMFWGSSGFFVTDMISDHLKGKSGQSPEKGTAAYVLDRGLVDTAINMGVFGGDETDIAFGSRIGTGGFVKQLFQDLTNTSPYGDKSPIGVYGGAGAQTTKEALDSLTKLGKMFIASNGAMDDLAVRETFIDLTRNINTSNNLFKGYTALKLNQLYSGTGTLIDDEVTTPEAIALALGINNSTMENIGPMMKYLSDEGQIVKDMSSEISKLQIEAWNNPDKFDTNMRQINLMIKMLDNPYLEAKIIRKANQYSEDTSSLSTKIEEKYLKERAQSDFNKRVADRFKESKK